MSACNTHIKFITKHYIPKVLFATTPGITQHVGYVLCCAAGICCGAAKMQSWYVNN